MLHLFLNPLLTILIDGIYIEFDLREATKRIPATTRYGTSEYVPTLRGAISDKGETNLYDFQRMLRKDSRWQYTQNARQEASDITLNVLRDFGFQG